MSQIVQTVTLKRWNFLLAATSFFTKTTVAHTACITISRIASAPVMLCADIVPENKENPAIFPISVVPVVSMIRPSQKKTK